MSNFNGFPIGGGIATGGTITGSLEITQDLVVGEDISCTNLTAADEITCTTLTATTVITEEELEVKDQSITMNAGALDDANATYLLTEFVNDESVRKWNGIGRGSGGTAWYFFNGATPKPSGSDDPSSYSPSILIARGMTFTGAGAYVRMSHELFEGTTAVVLKDEDDGTILQAWRVGGPFMSTFPAPVEMYDNLALSREDTTSHTYITWSSERGSVAQDWVMGMDNNSRDIVLRNTAGNVVLRGVQGDGKLRVGEGVVCNTIGGNMDIATNANSIEIGRDATSVVLNGSIVMTKGPIRVNSAPGLYTAGIQLDDSDDLPLWYVGMQDPSTDFVVRVGAVGTRAIQIDQSTAATAMQSISVNGSPAKITLKHGGVEVGSMRTITIDRWGLYDAAGTRYVDYNPAGGFIDQSVGLNLRQAALAFDTTGSGSTGYMEGFSIPGTLRFMTPAQVQIASMITATRTSSFNRLAVSNTVAATNSVMAFQYSQADKTQITQNSTDLVVADASTGTYLRFAQGARTVVEKPINFSDAVVVGTNAPATQWTIPSTRATSAGQVLMDQFGGGSPSWRPLIYASTEYGANCTGSANYLARNGSFTTGLQSSGYLTKYASQFRVNAVRFTYTTQSGNATSQFTFYVNGVIRYTFTLTGALGSGIADFTMDPGDVFELRYDNVGTAAGQSVWTITFQS